MSQLSIDFTPGLLEQYPEFMDCVRASVYGCGRAFKMIAADLDMTVSELSRKLANNPNDPVHFPLQKLPALIQATNDTKPIQWLVLSFMNDPEAKKRHAIDQLATLAPILSALVEQAGIAKLKAVA